MFSDLAKVRPSTQPRGDRCRLCNKATDFVSRKRIFAKVISILPEGGGREPRPGVEEQSLSGQEDPRSRGTQEQRGGITKCPSHTFSFLSRGPMSSRMLTNLYSPALPGRL